MLQCLGNVRNYRIRPKRIAGETEAEMEQHKHYVVPSKSIPMEIPSLCGFLVTYLQAGSHLFLCPFKMKYDPASITFICLKTSRLRRVSSCIDSSGCYGILLINLAGSHHDALSCLHTERHLTRTLVWLQYTGPQSSEVNERECRKTRCDLYKYLLGLSKLRFKI